MCDLTADVKSCDARCSTPTGFVCTSADDLMALSEDRKYIKRKAKYQRSSTAELGFCKATKAVEISLDLASASKHGGVLVPADLRWGSPCWLCSQPESYIVSQGVVWRQCMPLSYLNGLVYLNVKAGASMRHLQKSCPGLQSACACNR